MKKLQSDETTLVGKWIIDKKSKSTIPDATALRIEWLVENHLRRVTTDRSGWDTLFVDESDGRYWEKVYLESHRHGGGPPTLRLVSDEQLGSKFKIS